jgi:hypothetical protein
MSSLASRGHTGVSLGHGLLSLGATAPLAGSAAGPTDTGLLPAGGGRRQQCRSAQAVSLSARRAGERVGGLPAAAQHAAQRALTGRESNSGAQCVAQGSGTHTVAVG